MTFGLCTLIILHSNTSYRSDVSVVAELWNHTVNTSSWQPVVLHLTTLPCSLHHAFSLFQPPGTRPDHLCESFVPFTLCLEKLQPASLSDGWALGHLSWTLRSDAERKRKRKKKSICSENRFQHWSWCYRLEIHFRRQDQWRMGQMRSNNWMAPIQDDQFRPSLQINYGRLIRTLYQVVLHFVRTHNLLSIFFYWFFSKALGFFHLSCHKVKWLTVLISVIKYTENI